MDIRDVDPRELRVLPFRSASADPWKLQLQIARHGASLDGMPPLVVAETADGALVVYDGVTRATRIALLSPGSLVPVEVTIKIAGRWSGQPKIGDLLP
jgi:hypothetical protein